MALLSARIVEGEKIAIQAPSREFGEAVKADPQLTQEYVDLSNRVTEFFSSVLPQTPIVLADNVTEYLCGEEAIRSNAKWDLKDVPTVTPPFKGMFIETARPKNFDNPDIQAWGAYFSRLDEVEAIDSSEITANAVRWVVEMALIYSDRGVLKTYPAVWVFYLGGDGQLLHDNHGDILYETATLAGAELAETVENSKRWDDLREGVFSLLLPFFWSFGFMHCKNVTLETPPVSRQVRRQAERKGTPLLDYRVLNIEPMKRVLKDEGNLESVGPRQALHICRGHFKTYSEDKPLFGKFVGTFWWEGSVRGSLSKGKIDKDYLVIPPVQ